LDFLDISLLWNIFFFAKKARLQWATSAGADFYECGMQALVHRWQKCIANGGYDVAKIAFCS
jgi:hypothetical protein